MPYQLPPPCYPHFLNILNYHSNFNQVKKMIGFVMQTLITMFAHFWEPSFELFGVNKLEWH